MTPRLPAAPWLLLRCTLQRPAAGPLPSQPGRWQAPAIEAGHLRRFNALLGFAADALPLSYHYLALQRAQLAWMLQPGFPHRLLGMVHMAQSLERLTPWDRRAGYELELQGQAEGKRNLLLRAELRQHGRAVLAASSLYRPARDGGARPLRERAAESPPAGAPIARWALPAGTGRRYAWVSGDANPIHLGRWGARLFGMKRPIIHGAHTLARCEAELGGDAQRIAMRFLRPLGLPGEARLHREDAAYAVWGAAGRCAELELS